MSLLLLHTANADLGEVRQWRDVQGNTTNAIFVRVEGSDAILKLPQGGIIRAPINGFSDEDQAQIINDSAEQGLRLWTDQLGNQLFGEFTRYRAGKVYVKSDRGVPRNFPFESLSLADQHFVMDQLSGSISINDQPQPSHERLEEPRGWERSSGFHFEGQLDRLLPSRKLLLAVNGITWVVPADEFSMTDLDYLREHYAGTNLAVHVPRYPKNQRPPEVASAGSPPSAAASFPRGPAGFPMRTNPTQRIQAGSIAAMTPPQNMQTQQQERMARAGLNSPDPFEEMRERNQALSDGITERQNQRMAAMHKWMQGRLVCEHCEREAPEGYRAGDLCPHCHPGDAKPGAGSAPLQVAQSNQSGQSNSGNNSSTSGGRISGRGIAGLFKLGFWGVIGLGALFGWLRRQM
ncbi:hypothetical protein [Calycomorphotria hydatis]|nr:hypothetical protein [Calycomorphotria hydatis]